MELSPIERHFGNGAGYEQTKKPGVCPDCGADFMGVRRQKRCPKCAKARNARLAIKAALKRKKK